MGSYELAKGHGREILKPGEFIDDQLLGEIQLRDINRITTLKSDGELLSGFS